MLLRGPTAIRREPAVCETDIRFRETAQSESRAHMGGKGTVSRSDQRWKSG
jgi:hypothetical protein